MPAAAAEKGEQKAAGRQQEGSVEKEFHTLTSVVW
jgi:hypothetical protein